MDEKNNLPEAEAQAQGTAGAPADVSAADATATQPQTAGAPASGTAPASAPEGAPVEPAASSYDAQYAAQPTPVPVPTAQPAPPAGAAPASPTPALVCGILAIVLCGFPIFGIVLGIVAIVLAGKYYAAGGTEGTAKGGRICGIIGIVLSVIMIIVSAALLIVGLNQLKDVEVTERATSTTLSASSSSAAEVSADEQAIYDAVDPYLEQIKNQDPAMVAAVAAVMEDSFNESMDSVDAGVTLADCGVDATELASAMMTGFEYEPYYVSDDDSDAEANYKVTVRSIFDVTDSFYDEVVKLTSEVSAGSVTEEEAYQLIGQALMTAVQNCTPEADNLWDVDVEKSGGSWTMEMDSWDDELDYFFAFI